MPPLIRATAVMTRVAARAGTPGRYGSSGTSAPHGERQKGDHAGHDRGRQLIGIDAQFLAGVDMQGRAGVGRYRGGHPGRGLGISAVVAEIARQLVALGARASLVAQRAGGSPISPEDPGKRRVRPSSAAGAESVLKLDLALQVLLPADLPVRVTKPQGILGLLHAG